MNRDVQVVDGQVYINIDWVVHFTRLILSQEGKILLREIKADALQDYIERNCIQ